MKPTKYNSRFIATEGNDGSGKESVTRAIAEYVEAEGLSQVATEAFPRYITPPGRLVKRYLDNKFGPATEVHHDLASSLYTVDRYLASTAIRAALADGKLFIADRFTGSNMAHQGAKLADKDERHNFYRHIMHTEFTEWQIPRPEFNFVLLVSRGISQIRRQERQERGEKLDGHERDELYQRNVSDAFEELCEIYPDWFIPIDCMQGEKQKPPDVVNRLVINKIEEVL